MSKEITVDKLLAHCVEEDGHLIWVGHANAGKYPQINIGGKVQPVRRLVYEAAVGPITKGFQVGVSCGRKLCVHPDCVVSRRKAKAAPRGVPLTADRKARIARARRAGSALTIEKVREIRASDEPGIVIDAREGFSPGYASHIRLGVVWKDYSNPFAGLGAR